MVYFMHKLFSKKAVGIFAGFLLIALTAPLFTPLIANADFNSADPTEQTTSTSYYRSLGECIKNNMYGDIQLSASDNGIAKPSSWFDDNRAFVYIYPTGKTDCKDIVPKALELWGWGNDYSGFLKAIGYKYNASSVKWQGDSNGDNRQSAFDSAVQAKYYNINFAGNPSQSGEAKYPMFVNVFNKACNAKDLGSLDSITNSSYKNWLNSSSASMGAQVTGQLAGISGFSADSYVYFSKVKTIDMINGQYTPTVHGYAYSVDKVNDNWNKDSGNQPTNGDVRVYGYWSDAVIQSCHQIQKGITDNAGAWLAWTVAHPNSKPTVPTSISNVPGATSDQTTSCAVDGIGWIICPVITFMAGIADGAFVFLSNSFLKTDPKVLDISAANGTFTAWSIMRTVANVAFVIIFLIIIFSQLTSMGVSNYGVKKMLPRLIIAAILVNLSFFISQLAVDISNILGFSIKDLFDGMTSKVANTTIANGLSSNPFNTGGGFAGIAGTVIATAIIGVAGYAMLSTLIPVLLAAVVALVMILFILVARQAIIILLIVISPLAFVAFLLPNTEKLFTQWRKILTAMLLLFPIIALVFGASQLASQILTDAQAYKDVSGTGGDLFGQIIAAAILVLPLFVVPTLLKSSLDGIGSIGGKLNGFASKMGGGLGKAGGKGFANSRLGKFQQYRSAERAQRNSLIQSGAFEGKYRKLDPRRLRNLASSGNKLVNNKSGTFGTRLAASGISLADETTQKNTKAASILLNSQGHDRQGLRKVRSDSKDPAMRRAAVEKMISTNDITGINQMVEDSHNWSDEDRIHLADTLGSAGSRPAYLGQGTLAKMRQSQQQARQTPLSVKNLVETSINAGAYSAAKIATGDGDELTFVAKTASEIGGQTQDTISRAALDAATDQRLAPTIGKNKAQVENLANKAAPSSEQLKSLD